METFSISTQNHAPFIFEEIALCIDKTNIYNFRSCRKGKNKYGNFNFCNISISKNAAISNMKGLYCFLINNELAHVGKTDTNIKNIINNGYGKITESKCLVNGNSTFCRINSLITSDNSNIIQLFICKSNEEEDFKLIKESVKTYFSQKHSKNKANKITIYSVIYKFFKEIIIKRNIEIHNEFCLQHELGIYLKECFPSFKIQFEENISKSATTDTIKKEIDISIYEENGVKYAIELKCPKNDQYPEQMYSFIKDIKFMEQLKKHEGFKNTYCVTLVFNKNYYTPAKKLDGIYKYFRKENKVYGNIYKPTGQITEQDYISVEGSYKFTWNNIDESDKRFYIIEI